MMQNNKKFNTKLVTHNGSFHADDIFAAATLALVLEKAGEEFEIIRTRDPEIINSGDYVFDVGGIYDAEKNRFDHHQRGGAGPRFPSESEGGTGIEYASFGLVWKKFGMELCGSPTSADLIDRKLVAPIDAGDNGISIFETKHEIFPYLIQNIFSAFGPTWNEEDLNIDGVFLKCIKMAKEILLREIVQAKDYMLAQELVFNIYKNSVDKRILILDKNYPEEIFQNFPETLFVVYPRIVSGWGVRAVKESSASFKNKKDFSKSWAGLRDEELQNVTGVQDAIFCHRALFLVVAKSKEGAIALARKALES